MFAPFFRNLWKALTLISLGDLDPESQSPRVRDQTSSEELFVVFVVLFLACSDGFAARVLGTTPLRVTLLRPGRQRRGRCQLAPNAHGLNMIELSTTQTRREHVGLLVSMEQKGVETT